MEALTDSESGVTYDPKGRPGVSNLLEILKHATESSSSCEELAKDLNSLTMRQLKNHVSQAVVKCLSGIRESYHELMLPSNEAVTLARGRGRSFASSRAGETMQRVRKHIGMRDEQWPKIFKEVAATPPSRPLIRKDVRDFGPRRPTEFAAQTRPSYS